MAYYVDGYWLPQEHTTYGLVPYQDSVSFSDYEARDLDTYDSCTVSEFHQPNYGYSYSCARPEVNYFTYNFVEPKLIAYEPVACDTGYVSYHTHHSISYSTANSGFNEPEFEEYDPTPYGGGYDIVSTYGKPLPPSDQTCYPRSTPNSIEPKPKAPSPKFEPEPEHKPVSKLEPEPMSDPAPAPAPAPAMPAIPLGLGNSYPGYGYDYPWPEYDHGYGNVVGYDYGYGKQVVQVPPLEYNPEVVDFCEGIFGHWPCLARIRTQQSRSDNNAGTVTSGNGYRYPWEGCANYIFGGPVH